MSDETVSVEQAVAELGGASSPSANESATETTESTSVAAEDAAPSKEATDAAGEPVKVTQPSSKVQKIVDSKFGGDWDKFVDSLYEQQNSAARLKEELDEIKTILKTPPPVEVSDEIEEDHPDLAWFVNQSTAFDAEKQTNNQRIASVLIEIGKVDKNVARTEGELLRADPEEKSSLENKKYQFEARLESLYDKWESLKSKDGDINQKINSLDRQRKDAEKQIKAEKVQQQRQESSRIANQAKTVDIFEAAVVTEAEAHGLPEDARKHMGEVIAAEASYYLRSLPPNTPAIDIPTFVKSRAEAYITTINNLSKTKFAALGKEKLATKTEVSPKGTQAPAAATKAQETPQAGATKPWSKEFVQSRAAKILGG